ncbi:MAG: hypothetical protein O2960_13660 [Verrucomicrobia bacterium]|nr:hypothetical protein [Verrucomicrobiota bacterium]
MNSKAIREFLGWCRVLDLGMLILGWIKMVAFGSWANKVYAMMFGLEEASVRLARLQLLLNYIIAILVFNLAPYIALRVMAQSS